MILTDFPCSEGEKTEEIEKNQKPQPVFIKLHTQDPKIMFVYSGSPVPQAKTCDDMSPCTLAAESVKFGKAGPNCE